MKRHIMIGLLTMLVLAPAAEVFADTPPLMLTPEQQDELSIQAPSWVIEFPFCPNAGGLSFALIVTNRTTTPVPIVIVTVPSGQTPIQRNFNLGASQILGFTPTDVNCPAGLACRLLVVYPAGAVPVFDALVEIVNAAGQLVTIVTQPTFAYTTQ
jgi:hypothetical protein